MALVFGRSGLTSGCQWHTSCARPLHAIMKRQRDSPVQPQQVLKKQQVEVPGRLSTPCQAAPRFVNTKQAAPKASNPAAVRDTEALWLIVGLGNPGSNYEKTRHNVGFMVVDELAKTYGIDCRKLEKSAAVGKGRIEGQLVLLAKPMTFMNNSGESVAALAKFYKVPTQRILVISDDLDIPHAALRMRAKGGHGGHNGLRSIMERLGNTQDFPRLKLGIGRPAGQLPIATWVLQDFTRKETEEMDVTIQQACDAVKCAMSQGLEKALSSARQVEALTAKPKKADPPPASAAPPKPAVPAIAAAISPKPVAQTPVAAAKPVELALASATKE